MHEIFNNVVCASSKASDQPALEYSMIVKVLTEHRLEFLSFKGGSPESNNVVCTTSKGSDQPAHTRSLIRAFVSRLSIP